MPKKLTKEEILTKTAKLIIRYSKHKNKLVKKQLKEMFNTHFISSKNKYYNFKK